MKDLHKITAALLAILALAVRCQAAESGAEFLRLDTGARAVAMGAAYTAMADGVNSIGYNPAGLSSARSVEVGFTHSNWLMDTSHDFLGLAMPVKALRGLSAGFGLTRLSAGGISGRNADRSAGGVYGAYDQAVTFGLAGLAGHYRAGAAVKYIESSLAGERATAVAVDLGLARTLGGRLPLTLGFSVQNLGTPLKYITQKDPLPLTFAAGMLLPVLPGFNLALDVKRLAYDRQTTVSIGSEYGLTSGLALRTGYMSGGTADLKTRGLTMGAGITVLNAQLDYAAGQAGLLGNVQKFTLTKRF